MPSRGALLVSRRRDSTMRRVRVANGLRVLAYSTDREYNVTLHDVNSPVALTKHGERLYDQLIILSAKMKGNKHIMSMETAHAISKGTLSVETTNTLLIWLFFSFSRISQGYEC